MFKMSKMSKMFRKYIKIAYAGCLTNRRIQNYILNIYIQVESLFINKRNFIVGYLFLVVASFLL